MADPAAVYLVVTLCWGGWAPVHTPEGVDVYRPNCGLPLAQERTQQGMAACWREAEAEWVDRDDVVMAVCEERQGHRSRK